MTRYNIWVFSFFLTLFILIAIALVSLPARGGEISSSGNPDSVYVLNVIEIGRGGTVSVTPRPIGNVACIQLAGFHCYDYYRGTIVTLTAHPWRESHFIGWRGACAGTGVCQLTMDANYEVSAIFGTSDPVTTLITHYYSSILQRMPDSEGLAYWKGLIDESQSRGIDSKPLFRYIGYFFFNSTEYLQKNTATDPEFIADLYLTFFQRSPDNDGLNFWLGQLADGMSRNQILIGFLDSEEFNSFMQNLGF